MNKPVLAALVSLCLAACSSPPALKFPSGNNRVPVNAARAAPAASAAVAAVADTQVSETK